MPETAIESLKRCARAAEKLDSPAGLALAGNLYLKAWQLEHGPSPADAADDSDGTTELLEWMAAERARIEGEA